MSFSKNVMVVDQVTSTNSVLYDSSFEDFPIGSVLQAKRQSGGRGRGQRSWISELGGLYISFLLCPKEVQGLALLGAYSVIQMCRRDFSVEAKLRWPNDVTIEERKLAGVLPQAKFLGHRLERAVLGLGLNVSQTLESFPADLREESTTLSHFLGQSLVVDEVRDRFLEHFEREYQIFQSTGCAKLCQRCETYLQGFGELRRVEIVKKGGVKETLSTIKGLGREGELLLEDGSQLSGLGLDERFSLEPHFPPLGL